MFNWINPILSPFFAKPTPNPRLTSYIDFHIDKAIVDFITVNDTRLYFESFNPAVTVSTLQAQYSKFHGKQLTLENNCIKISSNMPLTEILTTPNNREIFQDIVNKIERNQQVKIENVLEEKKSDFSKIVKICNDFSSYDCRITMQNGVSSNIHMGLKIQANTTFNKIIKEMSKEPQIIGEDIAFRSEAMQYDEKDYNKTFRDLGIREKELFASYSSRNSFVRGNVQITTTDEKGSIDIRQLNLKDKREIISYDSQNRRFIINRIINCQSSQVKSYFRLTLSLLYQDQKQKNQTFVFQCTGSVRIFVLTKDFNELWIPVSKLSTDDQIGGVNPHFGSFVLYRIHTIKEISLEVAETFYGIEVLPAHQYVANNIIVHNNNDKFRIKAYHINDEDKQIEEIFFERNQKLSQVFGNKICQVGGHTLKNSQTFGDYQLQQFRIIYVYNNESIISKRREYTISEWKKQTKSHQEITQDYRSKLRNGYLGIYQQRIIPTQEIDELYAKEGEKNVNILVGIRTCFERLHYFMNKAPKYCEYEPQECQKYWKLKENSDALKKILVRVQKDLGKITKDDVLGMYLYTCNDIFKDLNNFLRVGFSQEILENERKFLPLAGWICKSSKKAEIYRGIVYRGIGNMDIEKAFQLSKEEMEKDRFIVFTAFTSASQSKKAASNFLGFGASLLLTINVRNGRSIVKYSEYPNEQEVLILPFTYFAINSFSMNSQKQTAEIEEIPMPETNSKKLIFWVDDQPKNNGNIIKYCFQKEGIEVVQVTSTRIMKIILKNFFWIFKMLGKKVVIISDMARDEEGVLNKFAGVDLFEHIYNQYGLSNKAIIFTGNSKTAYQNLDKRGIKPGNWAITVREEELVAEVMKEFQKM